MPISVYKNDILISEPRLARTQLEKARGLMFSKFHDVLFHFPTEERLKFHMVFVFYAIDIVFMDHELRVVDLKPRFRPFTVYYSKARSSTVLETYSGFIADHDIRIGDQLTITHDGEIPMKKHEPETKMLHTTSLGAPRPARTETVHVERAEAVPTIAKTSAKRTKKPAATTKPRSSTKKPAKAQKRAPKTTPSRAKPNQSAKRTKKPAATTKPRSSTKKTPTRAATKTSPARTKRASVHPSRASKPAPKAKTRRSGTAKRAQKKR